MVVTILTPVLDVAVRLTEVVAGEVRVGVALPVELAQDFGGQGGV